MSINKMEKILYLETLVKTNDSILQVSASNIHMKTKKKTFSIWRKFV